MQAENHDPRREALAGWLARTPAAAAHDPATLRPASSDASFRRYFRIDARAPGSPSLIVMDAPPPREDTRPFARVAALMAAAGAPVPAVLAHDAQAGFMLLGDFGSRTLLAELAQAPGGADRWYRAAGTLLADLQHGCDPGGLPAYDAALLTTELRLFDQWYLDRHLQRPADANEMQRLHGCYRELTDRALAQPAVFVHRDYHSRNLMCLPDGSLGMLDFQDAVRGPVTYDLVSLLRDAYIRWPEDRQLDWAIRYWETARGRGLPVDADFGRFYADFEAMGVQRHLKVLGIFARLAHRDGKTGFLADIPRVLEHLRPTLRRYAELAPIERVLAARLGDEAQVGYTF